MTASDTHRADGPAPRPVDVLFIGDAASLRFADDIADAAIGWVDPGVAEDVLPTLRRGVVVVVAPPADESMVGRVAHIRRVQPGVRAMLLDPSGSPGQRLEALRAGFDEALPHDLDAREIAARIAIQLRRVRMTTPSRLAIGDGAELDLEARALRRRGRLVHLRPLEFRLLMELAQAPGRPLSRAWLIERAWRSTPPPGSRTLDVHVRWLREKVERDPDHPVHLLTVRGVGYQLEPDSPDAPEHPAAPADVAGGDG